MNRHTRGLNTKKIICILECKGLDESQIIAIYEMTKKNIRGYLSCTVNGV